MDPALILLIGITGIGVTLFAVMLAVDCVNKYRF